MTRARIIKCAVLTATCGVLLLQALFLPFQRVVAPVKGRMGSGPNVSEVRALWVVRHTLTSADEVRRLIDRAAANGITDLVVQVRGRGDAYYNSPFEPRATGLAQLPPEFDPLALVIDGAHRSGLRVHAWLNTYLVSDLNQLPDSPQHLVYLHPEWLMVPRGLAMELYNLDPSLPGYLDQLVAYSRREQAKPEGLYVSPANPDVRDHLLRLWLDIATRYDVDGLHFDYVRYPSPEYDFSRTALERFRIELEQRLPQEDRGFLGAQIAQDPLIYVKTFPDQFSQFQRNQVSLLVDRISRQVRQVRPDLQISAAVFADENDAVRSRFQDWRMWLQRGWIDAVCPMAYTADRGLFERQITAAVSLAAGREVWSGIGVYRQAVHAAREKIVLSRRLGAGGFILFSYNSLIEASPNNPRGEYLEQLRDLIKDSTARSTEGRFE